MPTVPSSLAAVAPCIDDPSGTALLVDFDGSLALIVDDPAAARALPAALDGLTRLVSVLGRVAVVSGRPVEFLHTHVPVDGVTWVGLYGLERMVDGARVVEPAAREWIPAVAEAAATLERQLPDLLVERKGELAVTVHWRTHSARATEAAAIVAEVSDALGLDAPLRGRMAMEVRPPVGLDKGTVTSELVQGMRVGMFAGDDAGDLPAFDALRRARDADDLDHAICIGVRSDEGPPGILTADLVVDGPRGLAQLFADLATAIESRS
ncbi:MAG: trehalose-phosphatase [Acidimicrobiia bacterium]